MGGPESFYTRAAANEGRRMPLKAPDGKPTEHWLLVRHVWSDAFMDTEQRLVREEAAARLAAKAAGDDPAGGSDDRAIELLVSLVAGWSFEAECNPAAVRELLVNAPQIRKQLDRFAADARAFFGASSAG